MFDGHILQSGWERQRKSETKPLLWISLTEDWLHTHTRTPTHTLTRTSHSLRQWLTTPGVHLLNSLTSSAFTHTYSQTHTDRVNTSPFHYSSVMLFFYLPCSKVWMVYDILMEKNISKLTHLLHANTHIYTQAHTHTHTAILEPILT